MWKIADISKFEGLQRNTIRNSWKDWLGITGLKERNEGLRAFERRRDKVDSMLNEIRVLAKDMGDKHQGDKIERLQRLFDKAQDEAVLDHIERELVDLSMVFVEDL